MPENGRYETPKKTFRIPDTHEKMLSEMVRSGKFPTRTAAVLHGIEHEYKESVAAQ